MTIDKQKLQKLLWAEAASFRADCADWKRNTEALQEFLGEKTVEEVAPELLAENEVLRRERDARHPFKPFHEPAIGFTGCVICGVYTDHGGLPCPKTRATAIAHAAMGKRERS